MWFVPAHSIESFPKQLAKVRDAGHEMWENTSLPASSGMYSKRRIEYDVLKYVAAFLAILTNLYPHGANSSSETSSQNLLR